MKYTLMFLVFILASNAFAGGYYRQQINTYDQETGFYYRSVMNSDKSGFLGGESSYISNINVFNPETNESKLIFPTDTSIEISEFLFESAIRDNSIVFNSTHSGAIKNNAAIENRKLNDKLLIVLRNPEPETRAIYTANKDGSGITLIKVINREQEWHLDAKKSVIRIITQGRNSLKIESLEW